MVMIELFLFLFGLLVGLVSVSDWLAEKSTLWAGRIGSLQAARPLAALLSAGASVGSLLTLFFFAPTLFHAGGFSGFVWVLSLLDTFLLLFTAGMLLLAPPPSQAAVVEQQAGLPRGQLALLQPLLGAIAAGLGFLVLLLRLISIAAA